MLTSKKAGQFQGEGGAGQDSGDQLSLSLLCRLSLAANKNTFISIIHLEVNTLLQAHSAPGRSRFAGSHLLDLSNLPSCKLRFWEPFQRLPGLALE